jgi:hypothetical protein
VVVREERGGGGAFPGERVESVMEDVSVWMDELSSSFVFVDGERIGSRASRHDHRLPVLSSDGWNAGSLGIASYRYWYWSRLRLELPVRLAPCARADGCLGLGVRLRLREICFGQRRDQSVRKIGIRVCFTTSDPSTEKGEEKTINGN